jgi:hypothetical protein
MTQLVAAAPRGTVDERTIAPSANDDAATRCGSHDWRIRTMGITDSSGPTAMREMTSQELIERAISETESAIGVDRSETIVHDLSLAIERIPAGDPVGVAFDRCPACDRTVIARLPAGWQDETALAIPIVGCGNPWHYATRSMGDGPPVASELELASASGAATMPAEAVVEIRPGESVVVQIVDPAPGLNRVVIHRSYAELGHTAGGGTFTEAVCRRCGLMIAYAVRDQVVCGGVAGVG